MTAPEDCDLRNNVRLTGVTVRRASQIGFLFGETSDTIRCQACSALDGGAEGFRFQGANAFLDNWVASGNATQGARVLATASTTLLVNGDARGNGSAAAVGAADTRVRNVLGFCQAGDPDCWVP